MTVLPGHRLALAFLDGRQGVIDCSAILISASPGVFAPLADADYFAQARLELGAPTWPNGADLDPHWLYRLLESQPSALLPF